jgi:hypothetical protein
MCTYCGCRAITVIARLTAEHEAIVNATGVLVRAAADADTASAQQTGRVLGALLHPHTVGEETGLFTALRADPEFTEHVESLCAEHREIDALLDRVVDGDLGAVTGLEHLLRRHIDREENGVFPAAAIALDGDTWDRLESLA